ncbi:MAG: hypothetical protein U5L95_03725 [Candidatus Saccharibacteria bacterium]|nr:hypothetical protein [Candidatus Saccharibacteria bacterium]
MRQMEHDIETPPRRLKALSRTFGLLLLGGGLYVAGEGLEELAEPTPQDAHVIMEEARDHGDDVVRGAGMTIGLMGIGVTAMEVMNRTNREDS